MININRMVPFCNLFLERSSYLNDKLKILFVTIFPWGCTEFPELSIFREIPEYSRFSKFVATLHDHHLVDVFTGHSFPQMPSPQTIFQATPLPLMHAKAALFYSSVNDTDALNCCFIHWLMSPRLLLNSSVFHWWLSDSTRLRPRWIKTRKPSCRWQTSATLAKSLHGLCKSSGVVSCIASLPIDSVPMVSYYVLYSKCVCKMHRFGDTRLLKLPWPWNPGQGSLKVMETDTIR